jgi:hypothetical protein
MALHKLKKSSTISITFILCVLFFACHLKKYKLFFFPYVEEGPSFGEGCVTLASILKLL